MSKYYVNKFLYTVDRDPSWVARYKEDAATALADWEKEVGIWLNDVERTSWVSFTDEERRALVNYDYVWLFENGAHFFLSLTLFIAVFEEDYTKEHGPLSFQKEFARKLDHWLGKDYPSVAL
ncbi:hypothetical protein [Arthrobacter nitrophenolicus]|uniref:Uncharacterized protein n=1 Tax=Arthrobacter nitrophenolicus TaxID=683150 RepID=A0A4R5XR11_9MICC|nr:hypothetical protein [Arthrobacter nitrophenolicus]TDL33994.1 hypothetical protein E2R57_15900 [Arthrobacter nitrophenolicus]